MGNFDNKNIRLRIEVRENLTDSRLVEFVKDWNFTKKECYAFLDSLVGSCTTEMSKRIVQFFIDYKDGVLLPDRCGGYEPLREKFEKDKLDTYVDWLSFPAGELMLRKNRKYSASIKNDYWGISWFDGELIVPKRILPEYLGRITFWFAKQRKIDMVFLEQLLRDFCNYLHTDVGYLLDDETKTVLLDISHPEKVGSRID